MSKNCYLCGEPTQNPERVHTPCLLTFLRLKPQFGNETARRMFPVH